MVTYIFTISSCLLARLDWSIITSYVVLLFPNYFVTHHCSFIQLTSFNIDFLKMRQSNIIFVFLIWSRQHVPTCTKRKTIWSNNELVIWCRWIGVRFFFHWHRWYIKRCIVRYVNQIKYRCCVDVNFLVHYFHYSLCLCPSATIFGKIVSKKFSWVFI